MGLYIGGKVGPIGWSTSLSGGRPARKREEPIENPVHFTIALILFPTLVIGGGILLDAIVDDAAHIGTLVGMIVGLVLWLLVIVVLPVVLAKPQPAEPRPRPRSTKPRPVGCQYCDKPGCDGTRHIPRVG